MMQTELKNRVTIISEDNFQRLMYLYGEIDIDCLSRIVNQHIAVAIDEIMEDYGSKHQQEK